MGHNELTDCMAQALNRLLAFAESELEQRKTSGNDEEIDELECAIEDANSALALYEVDVERREVDAVRYVPTAKLDFEGLPRYAIVDHDGNPVKSYRGLLPGNDGMIGEPYAEEPAPDGPLLPEGWPKFVLAFAALVAFACLAGQGLAAWLRATP